MADHGHHVLDHPEVRAAGAGVYIAAFVVALGAMVAACVVTLGLGLPQLSNLITISLIALVAVLAQLFLMFKLDLSRARIWHTVSLVLTIPLFFMAIGLTIWMFRYLAMRTMVTGG